ncbi:MAG: hypothetical protein LBQ95_08615 [Lachnospiraceae bacterium]|nr:hypothetical protein [Lachnospiraceae bacterium]
MKKRLIFFLSAILVLGLVITSGGCVLVSLLGDDTDESFYDDAPKHEKHEATDVVQVEREYFDYALGEGNYTIICDYHQMKVAPLRNGETYYSHHVDFTNPDGTAGTIIIHDYEDEDGSALEAALEHYLEWEAEKVFTKAVDLSEILSGKKLEEFGVQTSYSVERTNAKADSSFEEKYPLVSPVNGLKLTETIDWQRLADELDLHPQIVLFFNGIPGEDQLVSIQATINEVDAALDQAFATDVRTVGTYRISGQETGDVESE